MLSGTTITVTTTADVINDSNIHGPTVSLREAINYANADTGNSDTITFASSLTASGPATITLNGTELAITNSMAITGPGASQLTIDGHNASRIFDLNGPSTSNVAITGLTLQHGNASSNTAGGAIANYEILTLSNDVIAQNSATYYGGGGIFNAGTLTTTNNTIIGNSAAYYGGGIFNSGTLLSTNDTISGNTATYYGGGVFNNYGALATAVNDTVSGNNANQGSGGGVFNNGGKVTSLNSIVLGNSSPQIDGSTIFDAGGSITSGTLSSVLQTVSGNSQKPQLQNNGGTTQTIALVNGSPAISSAVALGHVTPNGDGGSTSLSIDNFSYIAAGDYLRIGTEVVLVQNVSAGVGTSGTLTVVRHQLGTSQTTLNGLPIWLATDATGYLVNSHDSGSQASQHLLNVNTTADPLANSAALPVGTLTLRNAIAIANGDASPSGSTTSDNITFASSLTASGPATIALNGAELTITNSMTITAPGASLLTIDGRYASRIFDLNGTTSSNVAISGLTLTHGYSGNNNGGAIYNSETLTLSNDTITGNYAGIYGGGIYNSGILTSISDTITGNYGIYNGGGIYNQGSITSTYDTISGNSTSYPNSNTYGNGGGIYNLGQFTSTYGSISGNSAYLEGGGIFNNGSFISTNDTLSLNSSIYGGGIFAQGKVSLTNDTIARNNSTYYGGGIFINGGTVAATHVTISGNYAGYYGGGIFNGGNQTLLCNSIVLGNSAAYSPEIYGSFVGSGNITGGVLASVLQTVPGNPLQPLLQDNGGATQTIALVAGSSALSNGVALGHVTATNGSGGTILSVDDIRFIVVGDSLKIGNEVDRVTNVTAGAGNTGTLTVVRNGQGTLNGQSMFLGIDQRGYRRMINDIGSVEMFQASITVTPYTVVYDGSPHTATGTVRGIYGEDLSRYLNLAGTTHTGLGAYSGDTWSFHEPTRQYVDQSATITDTIGFVPVVTLQPVSMNVLAGTVVTETVAASGFPTPSVQWQQSTDHGRTWNNIPGATSTTLTLTTSLGLNGIEARAVFTNALGSATTNPATLTVTRPLLVRSTYTTTAFTGLTTGTINLVDFTDRAAVSSPTTYTATINWGDGQTDSNVQVSHSVADGTTIHVLGSHTYTVAGNYSPIVTLNDAVGSTVTTASNDTAVIHSATDVSNKVSVTRSNSLTYDFTTGLYSSVVTINNISGVALPGDIEIVLLNLTPGVTLSNATGTTANGTDPWVLISTTGLAAGNSISFSLSFSLPSGVTPVNFTIKTFRD